MGRVLIKRSTTDSYASNVVFGELAFTANGYVLYVGDESNTAIAIAGKRTPGVLSANQAIVVDANSQVDSIKTVNLTVLNAASIANTLTVAGLTVSGETDLSGNISVRNVSVSNTLTVNGDIILRGSSLQLGDGGDVISIQATVNTSIIPTTNSTYNLGALTSVWNKIFAKEYQEPVDIPLNRKVDVLWKKLGFNKVRTDLLTSKKAGEETIGTDLIIKPTEIWNQSSSIPSSKPVSNSGIVNIINELECTEDSTSTSLRTWKSETTNWVPPRFGSTYEILVYVDSAGSTNPSSNGTQIYAVGSGNEDEWYFDYQSGVLHFIGINLPSSVTSGKSVFISGAKYVGNTGFSGITLSGAELTSATINSLTAPLSVADGGTGVSSFTANSILAAANSTSLAFKTGSNGQVMLITDNDVGFSDLDGGTY